MQDTNHNPTQTTPIHIRPGDSTFPVIAEGQGKSYFGRLYSIYGKYPVTAHKEFTVEFNGNSFLVIYGTHVNGGFCCIPNWQFGCELGEPNNIDYNAEMLSQRFAPDIAQAIAYGIRDAVTANS